MAYTDASEVQKLLGRVKLTATSTVTLDDVEDEKVLDIPLCEDDRIFIPWLDDAGFVSAKFEYQGERLARHSVQWYGQEL